MFETMSLNSQIKLNTALIDRSVKLIGYTGKKLREYLSKFLGISQIWNSPMSPKSHHIADTRSLIKVGLALNQR